MSYNDEKLELIANYITEELLYEIYKLKRINNLGVRCSKIEDVKKNRESLIQNLLKPINKNHFSQWLFDYFSKVKKKDIDSNLEELQVFFDLLIISLFNNDIEAFELYSSKLKFLYIKDNKKEVNNSIHTMKSYQDTTNNKILKKIEQKLKKLQNEVEEKDNQNNIQKASFQEKIDLLNNELKDMQRKLNTKNNEIEQLKNEKNNFKKDLNNLVNIKKDLEFQNSNLRDNLNELEKRLNEDLKKEIRVIGKFNLDLITNTNIKIEFLSIEEFLSFSVLDQELWILQYALTPREKYTLESSMKEIAIRNKVVKINSNSELLKLINTEYTVSMGDFK